MEKKIPPRILIVAHIFPPSEGIGGRRWAKFAKYLKREGAQIRVLRANLPYTKPSAWTEDVEHIDVQTYPHRFPSVLLNPAYTLLQKIQYRLALAYVKIRSKGTPYDRAFLDRSAYQAALEDAINSFAPDVVIISGGPFSLLYNALGFVSKHPEIRFVGDFRDPWSWAEIYGYNSLSPRRLAFEKQMEQKVVENFSLIISPSPHGTALLKNNYPAQNEKIQTLPHAFDHEDIAPRQPNEDEGHVKKLIYGGTIYSDVVEPLKNLLAFVENHSDKLTLDVYSHDRIKEFNGHSVSFKEIVPSKQFFQAASKADWQLLLISNEVKDDIHSAGAEIAATRLTKIYELAAARVPLLMLGHSGKLSEFVEHNHLGLFAENQNDMERILFSEFTFSDNLEWLEHYNYKHVTKQLMALLNIRKRHE